MIVVAPPAATAHAAMATETDTAIDPRLPDGTITMTDGLIDHLPAAVPLMTTLPRGQVVTRNPTVQLASTPPTRMSMDGPPMTVAHPHRSFLPVTDILVRATPRAIMSVAPISSSRRTAVVIPHRELLVTDLPSRQSL